MYTAHFRDGTDAPVMVRAQCPEFLIGLAQRHDGYMRCLFFRWNGEMQPDAWVDRVTTTPEQAAAAYRLQELSPAPGAKIDRSV